MPPAKTSSSRFYDLAGFARFYLTSRSIRSCRDVHTEDLTEAFRHHMGLGPFPTIEELETLCRDLEIELETLPPGSPLIGANTSFEGSHAIYLRADLPKHLTESTAGHELREVIERALLLVDPKYEGLDTSDNKSMHSESEFFTLCLLMQADAMHERLVELGFDTVGFAEERGRSLSSVLSRVNTIYGSKTTRIGPVAGLWLFERGTAHQEFKVKHRASLCGFSTDKARNAYAKRANQLFPGPNSLAGAFPLAAVAIQRQAPAFGTISLLDLFGNECYEVYVEPIFRGIKLTRLLVMAVRKDSASLIRPYAERLKLVVPV